MSSQTCHLFSGNFVSDRRLPEEISPFHDYLCCRLLFADSFRISLSEQLLQRPCEGSRIRGGSVNAVKSLTDVCTTKELTNEGDKNFFPRKCKNRFLFLTFGVSRSENLFHPLKLAFPGDNIVLLEL
jgi:hypothetical protein